MRIVSFNVSEVVLAGVLVLVWALLPATVNASGTTACAGISTGLTTHHTFMATAERPRQFAESADRIFRSASVPDVLKITQSTDDFSKGDLVMYFNRDGVCMSVSRDQGATWSAPVAVSISGDNQSGSAVDPSIVQLKNGKLRLYYYGPTSTSGDPAQIPGEHAIYSARSRDGIHFTRESGKRFSVEQITDPEVIKLGKVWLMYLSNGQQSLIARSRDGLRFTNTDKVWTGGGIPGAYVHDGVVDIFGCSGTAIVSARSTNGKDFGTNQVVFANADNQVCDPSPVKLNRSTYALFYKRVVDESSK